jgi:hypothetical protein
VDEITKRPIPLRDGVQTTYGVLLCQGYNVQKSTSACIEQAYPEQLLRPRGERPNDCHAAEKRDELSSSCDVTH